MKLAQTIILAAVACTLLAACGSTGTRMPQGTGLFARNWQSSGSGEAVMLSVAAQPGQKIRTLRTMEVTEQFNTGKRVTTRIEVSYNNHVLKADALGNPIHVRRFYENYKIYEKPEGGEAVAQSFPLEGCEIELVQGPEGMERRVLSGDTPPWSLNNLSHTGFDVALLPVTPVRVGQTWEIDASSNPGFASLLKPFGLVGAKNVVRARLHEVEAATTATIAFEWQVIGQGAGNAPMPFRMTGKLVIDLNARLVTSVLLVGKKLSAGDRQIDNFRIEITREIVGGWYR